MNSRQSIVKLGTLIIFSGLPGSGKSTLATQLASRFRALYLRIDTIEQGLRDVCDVSQVDGKGYRLAYRIAQENLRLGNVVIADSVNPWALTRREWNTVAQEIGAPFMNIEIVCTDKEEHRTRIEDRKPPITGLKMPTWRDVLKRDYQAWSGQHFRLDTSGKTIEQSLLELISLLKLNDTSD